MEFRRRYTVFGFNVRSDLELPELIRSPRDETGDCDVEIVLGSVASESMHADSPLMWIRQADFGVGYPDLARFRVIGGRRIVVDRAAGASLAALRLFLLGPIFALLLHQRGLLVLHASAVSVGGKVVAFAAEKGEGKSTLAAAMIARGHPLFTDDLMPIDLMNEALLVSPAYPQLKLYPEAASQLTEAPQRLERVHPDFEKRAQPAIRDFPTKPQPLSRIFILETGDVDSIEVIAIQSRFVELIRHSYLAQLVRTTGEAALHFSQVVKLATRVPVCKLVRRRDLSRINDVAAMIEREIAEPSVS